jgi:proteasome-associated ATPase
MVSVVVGDKVVMNSTNHVILQKIKVETKYAFKTQSVLTWDDIGACADAKKELIAALETPYAHKDLFDFFNKKQIKGVLLWGRAGNGKTLLGRAAAGSMARMHGKESADSGFIYIKGPEILDKYVGETESQIREAFAAGRVHFKKYGYPCILFLDEADAVLMRRGSRTASGMEMTIVPQFLSEMDGIEDSGVFMMLATNRADTLDPAVIRPGRVDRKIYVAPPTFENAPEIWSIHMKKSPICTGESKEQIIQTVNSSLYSEQFPLYLIDTPSGRKTFSLGNLVSGALIAGIVERASAVAIDRNVANNTREGLRQSDFNEAMVAMHKEQYGMNHYDELREFIDGQKLEVTSIETCHDGSKIERPKTQAQQVVAIPIPNKGGKYDA